MLKLVSVLTLLAVTSAISNGDWGLFKIMNRDTKCYGYDEGRNELWTRNCDRDDALQLWRYDSETQQLQNKGMSDSKKTPYCAVLSEVGNLKPIRMGPCFNTDYNKFVLKKGILAAQRVVAHEFSIFLDQGRCIDVDQWSEARDENIWTAPCETIDRARTDHWTVFEKVAAYKGRDLASLPKQASFSDGDWGALRLTPRLQECWGVRDQRFLREGDRLELEQQPCDALDQGQRWIFRPASRTIQNYRFPLGDRDSACLTFDNNKYYLEGCVGNVEQQFVIRDGVKPVEGTYQQVATARDTRRCVDVTGWNMKGWWAMGTANCESITTRDSDHWVRFEYVEAGVICEAGMFRKGQECVACPKDTFSKEGSKCYQCPEGHESNEGSAHCTEIQIVRECPAGMFVNGKANNCIMCPVNTFSDSMNSMSCTKCPDGFEAQRAGSTSCTEIAKCPAGTFVNGKALVNNCIMCPVNTFSDMENSAACIVCPEGFEAQRAGSTSCSEIVPVVTIAAVAKSSEVVCMLGKKKPACTIQCRFRTSDGVTLKNPEDVTFYKKMADGIWAEFGTPEFNPRYKWHKVEVAKKPQADDGGEYRCEITYQGMTASADVAVILMTN